MKMINKNVIKIVVGVTLIAIAIWGGSWFFQTSDYSDGWMSFPMYVTTVATFMSGVALTVHGATSL